MPEAADDMWLDRFARRLGFGWIAAKLPWDVPPSYVYAVVTLGFFTAFLNLFTIVTGDETISVENHYDVANYEVPDERVDRVADCRERIQQVARTGSIPRRSTPGRNCCSAWRCRRHSRST